MRAASTRCLLSELNNKGITMKLFTLLSLIFLTSCAGMKSSYPEGINVEKKVTTKSGKVDNHGNAMDWIALNFNNSNQVVKVNDKERGKIVLKGLLDCEVNNGGANVTISFGLNLSVASSDKLVAISMTNITSTDGWNYPRNDEQAGQVKSCLNDKIISPLEKALN